MNQPQIFNNEEFGSVRVVEINGSPWFVAADVCRVLEIQNPTVAVERLDPDERSKFNLGRQGEANIINESGLYALTITSRKPYAKKFRKWLTGEVAVSIRKTGMYIDPNAPIDPNFLRKLADEIESRDRQIAVLSTQIAELQPKASLLRDKGEGTRDKYFRRHTCPLPLVPCPLNRRAIQTRRNVAFVSKIRLTRLDFDENLPVHRPKRTSALPRSHLLDAKRAARLVRTAQTQRIFADH